MVCVWQLGQMMLACYTIAAATASDSSRMMMITDHISEGGNAIASVRLSVCFHSIFGTDWPLTLSFCVWAGHDHNSQGFKGQGHGWG